MKKVITFLFSIMFFSLLAPGMDQAEGRVRYTQTRPYSWYYPYKFNYYYPQLQIYGRSCQLTYIDGVFVYTCQ